MNINEVAELNDIDTLRQMIGTRQDINRFSRGMTPLMAAAANSSTEAVMLLIEIGARLDLVDKAGTTALMFAAMHGYERIVRLLIDSGADLEICDKKGSVK